MGGKGSTVEAKRSAKPNSLQPVVKLEGGDPAAVMDGMSKLFGSEAAEELVLAAREREFSGSPAGREEILGRCYAPRLDALFDSSLVRFADSMGFEPRSKAILVDRAFRWLAEGRNVGAKKAALESLAGIARGRGAHYEEVAMMLRSAMDPEVGIEKATHYLFLEDARKVLLSRYADMSTHDRGAATLEVIANECSIERSRASLVVSALTSQKLLFDAGRKFHMKPCIVPYYAVTGFNEPGAGKAVAEHAVSLMREDAAKKIEDLKELSRTVPFQALRRLEIDVSDAIQSAAGYGK